LYPLKKKETISKYVYKPGSKSGGKGGGGGGEGVRLERPVIITNAAK